MEPLLKYSELREPTKSIVCFSLSSRFLSIATSDNSVSILDYNGNEVRSIPQLHTAPITSLCFSHEEEHLAASSEDGSVSIVDLFSSGDPTQSIQRFSHKHPITSLSLDPRFSSRKTKEYVIGLAPLRPLLGQAPSADQGAQVVVCGAGWLGRSETLLHQEPPSSPSASINAYSNKVHVVRWSSSIVIWGTDRCVFAYDTLAHLKIRTLNRYPPPSSSSTRKPQDHFDDRSGGVSILFGPLEEFIYVGWKDIIKVARVLTSENNVGGLSFQIEVVHEILMDANLLVLGVAPFEKDLAVLVFNIHTSDSSSALSTSAPSTGSHELRILSLSYPRYETLAQDLLPVKGRVEEGWRSTDFTLLPPPVLSSSTSAKQREQSRRTTGGQQAEPSPSPPLSARAREDVGILNPELSMFFIVSPGGILVSKSRDLNDRISFLLEQKRFEEALRTTERAERGSLEPAAHEMVVEAYIEDLLSREAYREAAELSPRLLRDDASMWERWILLFAQTRQLIHLAPYVPLEPRLGLSSYEMVIFALLADVSAHGLLLDLVLHKWPASLVASGPLGLTLTKAVSAKVHKGKEGGAIASSLSTIPTTFPRMRDSGPSEGNEGTVAAGEPLHRLLCELHLRQGRPDLSLQILLDLRSLEVFAFIEQHSLYSELAKVGGGESNFLGGGGAAKVSKSNNKQGDHPATGFAYSPAALLLAIDEAEALKLLTKNTDSLPPSTIVPGIRTAMDRATSHADADVWRRRIYQYLQVVIDQDAGAATEFHEWMVQLTAEYAPQRLMNLLHSSHFFPLESALSICQRKGLVSEQVYLLNRMGNSRQALNLIIEKLRDVPRAIEFVRESRDEELWDHLMTWALRSSETTGSLMDHAGGAINPLSLIRRLPRGLHVPRLRDRIRAIVSDFRTQSSLHEGCRAILDSDCIRLVSKLYREARSCARRVYVLGPDKTWQLYDSVGGRFEQVQSHNQLPWMLEPNNQPMGIAKVFNDIPATNGGGEGEHNLAEAEEKAKSKAGARKAIKKTQREEESLVGTSLPSLIHF